MTRKELTDAQIEERFFKNKPGRPAKSAEVADLNDKSINTDAVGGALEAMRDQVAEEAAQIAQGSRIVGGALMAGLHKKFSAAAEVSMFVQLRELPLSVIRKIPISAPGETSATAETLDELCRAVFGRPYNSMAEEAQNLAALGDASYDLASRLGLNRSALRAARALPPEKLEAVRLAISNGSSKAEVLSVIEDLAEKVQRAEVEVADLRAEREADEQVRGDLRKKIDRLEREKKRIKTEEPDAVLADLAKEAQGHAANALGLIRGHVRAALQALANHHIEHGGDPALITMAGMVGQLQAELNALRAEFNLPDLSAAQEAQLASEVAQWAGAPAAH